ncbi:MAG: sensor histidine kinase [Hasllibacter sp.]
MEDGQAFDERGCDRAKARRTTLREYGLTGLSADPAFDALAALAARICRSPRATIAFLDEGAQRNLGAFGGASREHGIDEDVVDHICANTHDDLFEIADRRGHPVLDLGRRGTPDAAFLAAALVRPRAGPPVAAVVVTCGEPHEITDDERFGLRTIARQVAADLEMRRAVAAEARAIDALEKQNAILQSALDAERVLKMEIDHRVKNSLQLVASLLQMQRSQSNSAETKAALKAARGRVQAITSIHAALHRVSDMDRVFLPTFGNSLIEELGQGAPEEVVLLPRMGEIELMTSQASALAILMNEFVANSLKYAFPDGRKGTVRLEIARDGDRVRAAFADDGVGHNAAAPAGPGLGTQIMEAVAGQLGATLDFTASPQGTALTFDFPLEGRG